MHKSIQHTHGNTHQVGIGTFNLVLSPLSQNDKGRST